LKFNQLHTANASSIAMTDHNTIRVTGRD